MTSRNFGYSNLNKSEIKLCKLKNHNGMKVNILTLGAAVQSIVLPWGSRSCPENPLNVVLGFSNVEDYESNPCYIGVAVGRVAGRIGKGCFEIAGNCYSVTKNNGGNCLHGGNHGISRKNWNVIKIEDDSVELEYYSKHMDEGFPGDLEIRIKYTVTDDNGLLIEYFAKLDDNATIGCPVNLTNHSYFNLTGAKEGATGGIRDHIVEIAASKTLELNDVSLLPTGRIVEFTDSADDKRDPLDLRNNCSDKSLRRALGDLIHLVGGNPKGFDNYYIFDNCDFDKKQATVTDGYTTMSVYTDQPGVQFYTSNFFDKVRVTNSSDATEYYHCQHGALCLETQQFPDAVNHSSEFPNSTILQPGQEYVHRTVYKFDKA